MEAYVTRQPVRELNKKLFANDLKYSEDNSGNQLETLISNIIQRYDPEDALANIPTILEVKGYNINKENKNKLLCLDTHSVYFQFNNNCLNDKEKTEIISSLKDNGYKIIIELNKEDEFATMANILADIIKVDIHGLPDKIIKKGSMQGKLLAYNVDTSEDYTMAETSGVDLYEGKYIGEETSIHIDCNSHSDANFIEVIALINNEEASIDDIAKAIAHDSLMSAQVIRLSNSVYYRARTRIEKVRDAVVRIGLSSLKRWIFLLKFVRNDNVSEELLKTSYHRAVFCEEIAKKSKKCSVKSDDAYMIGLFSALDILTGNTIDKEMSQLNLSETIEDAIIYREGDGGMILNLVKAYEEANWKRVDNYIDKLKLTRDDMYKMYFKAADAVAKVWKSMTEFGGLVG